MLFRSNSENVYGSDRPGALIINLIKPEEMGELNRLFGNMPEFVRENPYLFNENGICCSPLSRSMRSCLDKGLAPSSLGLLFFGNIFRSTTSAFLLKLTVIRLYHSCSYLSIFVRVFANFQQILSFLHFAPVIADFNVDFELNTELRVDIFHGLYQHFADYFGVLERTLNHDTVMDLQYLMAERGIFMYKPRLAA